MTETSPATTIEVAAAIARVLDAVNSQPGQHINGNRHVLAALASFLDLAREAGVILRVDNDDVLGSYPGTTGFQSGFQGSAGTESPRGNSSAISAERSASAPLWPESRNMLSARLRTRPRDVEVEVRSSVVTGAAETEAMDEDCGGGNAEQD